MEGHSASGEMAGIRIDDEIVKIHAWRKPEGTVQFTFDEYEGKLEQFYTGRVEVVCSYEMPECFERFYNHMIAE